MMDWEPRVGMRVVCVSDRWPRNAWYGTEALPKEGSVYTVREHGKLIEQADVELIRLNEISNPILDYGFGFYEAAFTLVHFRPLDERRLDIFRAVLTKAPTPEKEPA